MDSLCKLSTQQLIDIIQAPNQDEKKSAFCAYIENITTDQLQEPPIQDFITRVIHLTAEYQQENLFWLIYSVCDLAQHLQIAEQKNKVGDKIIHTLARHPDSLNLLEGLLNNDPKLIGQTNDFQETALHVFLNTLAFDSALRQRFLTEQKSEWGKMLTLLSEPYFKHEKKTSNLIHYNKKGYSPLHLCALYGLKKELDFLLNLYPEIVNFPTQKKSTCLHIACSQGHLGTVKTLLNRQANVSVLTDKKANTPLHLAAQKGHAEICMQLIMADYNILSAINNQKYSALDLAKQHHQSECITLLTSYENTHVFSEFKKNFTPLYSEHETKETRHFKESEIALNTYLMGITLGFELAYQQFPEGKFILFKNELDETHLYSVHSLYNAAGITSHLLLPHNIDTSASLDIYITFQGTNNVEGLHRDVENKGPGYESYKKVEPHLAARFFKLLKPILENTSKKISITIAGHSLGGGDCFYFLFSLLKIMAQRHPGLSLITEIKENLLSDKTANAIEETTEICDRLEKILSQKPLIDNSTFLDISKITVIALNPVGLPKSMDHAIEGLTRYLSKKIKIESFVLLSEGDFAQRTSDRIPLSDISPQNANVTFLLSPGDRLALQKASVCYLGAAGLNPSNASTNLVNIGADMTMLGTMGALTLGPIGLLAGLAAGGVRLYASKKLQEWGKQFAFKPHSSLLPNNAEQDLTLLEKVTLFSNKNVDDCTKIRDMGHNLNTSTFERYITEQSRKTLTKQLKKSLY